MGTLPCHWGLPFRSPPPPPPPLLSHQCHALGEGVLPGADRGGLIGESCEGEGWGSGYRVRRRDPRPVYLCHRLTNKAGGGEHSGLVRSGGPHPQNCNLQLRATPLPSVELPSALETSPPPHRCPLPTTQDLPPTPLPSLSPLLQSPTSVAGARARVGRPAPGSAGC